MNQKPSPLHRASEWIVDHYRLFFVVFAALLVFSAVASGWVKVENDVAAYLPADSETRQGLEQGIAVLMQDETLRARAGASASCGDICALAQDLYTADMNTARTETAVWTGICIALFAAGALAFAGVCLGHRRGKTVAWCAALALLVLAFVAAGLTLRQRAQRAQ